MGIKTNESNIGNRPIRIRYSNLNNTALELSTNLNGQEVAYNEYSPKPPSPFIPDDSTFEILPPIDGKLTNDAGFFGFKLHFECDENPPKSISWTYSSILDKLFMSHETTCPFQFQFINSPPEGTVIRAVAVYVKPDHSNYPVHRCPTHIRKDIKERNDDWNGSSHHLIRCESPDAIYESFGVEDDCIYSVMVPYKHRNSLPNVMTCNYKMTCFTSCVGGMNRRPINILFTLERNGVIMGRILLNVRVCACAGRDRNHEEKILKKKNESEQFTNLQSLTALPSGSGSQKALTKLEMDVKKEIQKVKNVASLDFNEPSNKKRKVDGGAPMYRFYTRSYDKFKIIMELSRVLDLQIETEDPVKKEPNVPTKKSH